MTISIRPATRDDAEAMCALLNPIIAEGATTAHRTPFDADRMIAHYIAPDRGASCVSAWDGDRLMGFQALEWPDPDFRGWGAMPTDWGMIATFVADSAQGRGIGQTLFAATRAAARGAGMVAIDATIRADNVPGLAYYGKLGFVEYDRVMGVPLSDRTPVDRVRKVFRLEHRT